ncbi:MAG: alpha/beta fold hydrolase [Cyanobacteria bacterium P01_A01_bin.84]
MSISPPYQAEDSLKDWNWRGFSVCYKQEGLSGPAVVLIHGFGASWQHWRKNIPVLGNSCRVYGIDLIGFGASAKPQPLEQINYEFETWGQQIVDFCQEVIGEPAFLIGNSIGCIVAMQAAAIKPDISLGVALLNCSLRLLHKRKQKNLPLYRRWGSLVLQRLLSVKAIGNLFFSQIARQRTVRKILLQAYQDSSAVTNELIDIILTPAKDKGAAAVFLAFTAYSTGPLAEDLLPILKCPVIILWGTADPWEPIELGKEFAKFPQVQKFIPLEGVGHCPQDEAPDLVNPILLDWIEQNNQSAIK